MFFSISGFITQHCESMEQITIWTYVLGMMSLVIVSVSMEHHNLPNTFIYTAFYYFSNLVIDQCVLNNKQGLHTATKALTTTKSFLCELLYTVTFFPYEVDVDMCSPLQRYLYIPILSLILSIILDKWAYTKSLFNGHVCSR